MSYEGYEQHICENGHYFNVPCTYSFEEETAECPECKAPSAWMNMVNDTNCDSYGIIPDNILREHFLLSPEETQTCNLGHVHITKQEQFRIPTKDETNKFRYYRGEFERYISIETGLPFKTE